MSCKPFLASLQLLVAQSESFLTRLSPKENMRQASPRRAAPHLCGPARCSPLMPCSPHGPADASVRQTGAWVFPDSRPLSPELEEFLDAGEPPLYFGLGSRSEVNTIHLPVPQSRSV